MNDEHRPSPPSLPLFDKEERLRSVVTSMAEGVVLQAADGTILDCNAAAERILGLSRSQIEGRTSLDPTWRAIHEDGSPFPGQDHPGMVTLRTGEPLSNVIMGVRRPDGTYTWISVSSEPLRSAPGAAPYGVVATFNDVTQLKHTEHELQRVLREKEILLESVDVGIALTLDRKIMWVNRRVEELCLYTREELVGRSIRLFYPSEEAYVATGQAIAAARAAGEVFQGELPLRRKDGSAVWIHMQGRALDPQNPERGTLWVVADRTAERQAHEALRRERERYLSIMRIAQDGIHIVDETGTLVEANPAFLRMLGRGPEALGQLRIRDWDVAIPSDQIEPTLRALHVRPGLFETRHLRPDGSTLEVEVHAGGLELEGRPYVLASSRDISARKELERQLALKQAQLEELNASLERRVKEAVDELRAKDQLLITQSRHAAMGEMIGNIAHQWRQPLNALGLVLSNLRDASRFGELTAAGVEEAVADGHRLVQKMSSTINDFRDFFRPEKERQPFSALVQIHETVRLVDASFRSAAIVIAIEAASDVQLQGHANEYSQVLLNVLANAKQAIQATRAAEGRVLVQLDKRDGWGVLTVQDNGGGIPEAILDKIFEPYFSTKDSGSGIGLYMSRQIVERSLGGKITAKNVPGGAEITVLVPLAAEA